MRNSQKLIAFADLPTIVNQLRKEGKKIVTTNGVFDILHIGQVRFLEQSKSLGDILIVGVNSDASVKQFKSEKRPIVPEAERAEMLTAFSSVDYVTIFDDVRPLQFLEIVRPDIHAKGGEYDIEKLHETELVRRYGGEVVAVEGKINSSTEIIDRILKIYQ